ncbi:MAG: beta strand repeat-containing protein, partial [Candidatus Neomarinimicrobiota bacterium]
MKKFIPILILFLTIIYGQDRFAQSGKNGGVQKNVVEKMRSTSNQNVPRRISYQGLITKADGSPTDDGSYEILFKIFETADGGEAIWSENQEVTVNNGIISTILGNTNPFTVVPPEAFLELTVSGSTLSPRQVLTSVFYSVLSDTSGYAKAADYGSLSNLPDLDVYVLKDSLASYPTSADLYDTLSVYQTLDSNLTDLVEDGVLSASKIEYGVSSVGDSGQTWISDGDGAGRWGNPSSVAADDIIIGDGNISIQTINGGVSIVPSDGYGIVLDSTLTIDGNLMGITNDTDLLNFSRDTLTVRGTVMASTIGGFAVLDEDDMASDSDLQLATQQSIKTYVDTKQDYDEDLETIGSLEHVDGNFLVSNGSEWTVESDSIARASLGLGSIAMLDSDNMDINGGTIDGTIIGAENPQVGNFTTVQAQSRAYVGDMIIDSGSISAEGGTISFDDDIITTTGTLSSGSGSTIGNLTLANGSISSSSNQLDFGDDDLSTTGTLSTGIATLGSGSTIGNLTFNDGTIASESDNISFGSDNLSTNGTITAGVSTFSSGSEIGDLTISNGSITSSSDAIDFGNDALSTTGTLSTGTATLATGSTVGNLTLADGSIISSSDAIDFGNDALSTTGTLSTGIATLATGSTVGNLTLADGSITSSSDAIDFGNNTLTTSSNITANSFIGDGSNITGVEASSMGVLAGVSPIVLEGESINDYEIILSVEDPTLSDKTITFPNATGTIITTGNDSAIDEVGTITAGQWQGTAISDAYVPNDITLSGGTIDNSVIGGTTPAAITATTLTANTGIISGGTIDNSVIGGTTPAAITATTLTANTGFIPDESDGAYLGTSFAEFSDVFLADGAVINLGDEQDVTLTHIEDTGIKLNGSNQLQFGDSGTQISQSADGVLDLISDNEVEINGTTIDLNGAVDVSGAITTGSTITTTGSLLPSSVDGAGLGSESAEFSDVFLADGGVINLGNNQDVTLTHIKDTGIKINNANQLQFGDSGTQISQSADGVLDLVSDSEVEINGTIIDMNGVVDISGAVTTGSTITTTGSLLPSSSDGAGIGSSTAEFSDVFLADGAVINLGDNQEVSLTHIEDEGLRLNSLSQLQFGDSGTKISQSADGVLDLVSDNEVEINGTTIDLNGDVTLDNATVDFVKIDGTYVGHVDDTDLMNLANGALTVSGTLAATTFSGDGSNLTGISASSIKADDVSQGDAAVNISTSSGAINLNPASGSPVLIDNTINIDGSLIGHTADTDLMTLANGSVTFTGSTVIPTADVNGG